MRKKFIFLKNNSFDSKLNGGALQYVIFVSVIIALLLTAFILLNNLQQEFKLRLNISKQLISLSNESINYVSNNVLEYDTKTSLNLSEKESFTSEVVLKHWGVYDVLWVKNSFKNEQREKIVMLGGYKKSSPALYLIDNKKPLVVVGTTKIQGKVFLPERGVKSGYISGKSYYNSQLIYGDILQSTSTLPALKNKQLLKQLSAGKNIPLFSTFGLSQKMNKFVSFENTSEIYKSHSSINLIDVQLTGNIYICSDTLIKVSNSAKLKDVILIAPSIEIGNGVTGSFQAFASDQIVIGNNCKLGYPSVLLLYENNMYKNGDIISKITISENTKLQGAVVYLSDETKNSYYAQINIEENVVVDGELYCDKNLDLKGLVNGSVYTNGFVAKQFGSVYQNHIYNGTINLYGLPKEYSGLQMSTTNKNVVKWLY